MLVGTSQRMSSCGFNGLKHWSLYMKQGPSPDCSIVMLTQALRRAQPLVRSETSGCSHQLHH